MATRYMFASYARQDAPVVVPILESVRDGYRRDGLDVEVWVDFERLVPGQRWEQEIAKALRDSVGLLVFVSPVSMRSDWVVRELTAAVDHLDRLIIPVMLEQPANLPSALAERQWLDLTGERNEAALRRAAQQIVDATKRHLSVADAQPPVPFPSVEEAAADLAQQARNSGPDDTPWEVAPESVFLVHGHDPWALSETVAFLTSLGITPFILSRARGSSQSLLQKFFTAGGNARFAVVLLSADDVGASRVQFAADGVGERALQFRARQNVILELGFFYGRLGWENVFVIQRPADEVYPNFERPSDIAGAVFDEMDAQGTWRDTLTEKLHKAGFRLAQ